MNETIQEAFNQQLKLAGEGGGLFMIDRELAARVFTMPTTPSQG
jgi:hypothetical protein